MRDTRIPRNTHRRTQTLRPTGNAVAEGGRRIVKEELIWTCNWKSIDELRQAVDIWRFGYNRQGPYPALGWQTPEEQRCAKPCIALHDVA